MLRSILHNLCAAVEMAHTLSTTTLWPAAEVFPAAVLIADSPAIFKVALDRLVVSLVWLHNSDKSWGLWGIDLLGIRSHDNLSVLGHDIRLLALWWSIVETWLLHSVRWLGDLMLLLMKRALYVRRHSHGQGLRIHGHHDWLAYERLLVILPFFVCH